MGMQRYRGAIRQANRGVDGTGEDTDMGGGDEAEQSKATVSDHEAAVPAAVNEFFSEVMETFRGEL